MPTLTFSRWLLPGLALLCGVAGVSALWVAVAVLAGAACGWVALLAAADAAFLLRLTQAPAGPPRAIIAVVATLAAAALSYWLLVATHLGFALGLGPLDSALRLGPVLATTYTRLYLQPADWAAIALSLPLAAWLAHGPRPAGRRGNAVSARRRSPSARKPAD